LGVLHRSRGSTVFTNLASLAATAVMRGVTYQGGIDIIRFQALPNFTFLVEQH
jgi:hypothetical protein